MRRVFIAAGTTFLSVFFFNVALAQLGTESVTVTTPNGGECYIPGSQVNATWQSSGVDHVALGYRTDNNPPPTWQQDFQSWDAHPVNGTIFKWTVPNITSNTVKLWIEGHNASHAKLALDSSNNTFTISNTCGIDEPPAAGVQVTQVLVGSTIYQTTDTIEVDKGKDLTLVGTAGGNDVVTIYVTSTEKKLSTTAGSDGKWTFDIFTQDLEEGMHQVDLETANSPRAKAFSFRVLPVGQAPTSPSSPSTPTPSADTTSDSSVQRSEGGFPYLTLGVTAGAALLAGVVTYLFVKRRGKRVDETPTEPPQIS